MGLTQEELQANRAIYKVLRDGIEARIALVRQGQLKWQTRKCLPLFYHVGALPSGGAFLFFIGIR
jgi:hypothetical protein